jgi:hypothetical protein
MCDLRQRGESTCRVDPDAVPKDGDLLNSRQKKFKSLRTKYSQFWHGVVGGIVDSSLLADEYLLPKLTQWLQAVSSYDSTTLL